MNGCGAAPQVTVCAEPDESPYEALRPDTVMSAGVVQDAESVMDAGFWAPGTVRVSVTDQGLSGDVTGGGSTVSVTRMLAPLPMETVPEDPVLPSLRVNP